MKLRKGTTSKEAYKIIMHDLECLDLKQNKNNEYHYKLLVGNIRDLFGITDDRLLNYTNQKEDTFFCLECGKEFELETDLLLCADCMDKFDTDKIWALHDLNKLDALDFNESEKFREKFRVK